MVDDLPTNKRLRRRVEHPLVFDSTPPIALVNLHIHVHIYVCMSLTSIIEIIGLNIQNQKWIKNPPCARGLVLGVGVEEDEAGHGVRRVAHGVLEGHARDVRDDLLLERLEEEVAPREDAGLELGRGEARPLLGLLRWHARVLLAAQREDRAGQRLGCGSVCLVGGSA